jgi:MoxR-like ATPase
MEADMNTKQSQIINEVKKVINGKDEIISKVLMAFIAQGHVLMEDIPGVGKTTLVLAFSKAMGLDYKRVQCTPDIIPSDIVGFSVYNKNTGALEFKPGAIMCNLFLADEINRTSSKTQSALLEVMQEGNVTVDGMSYPVPKPFAVIATQNPIGFAGTQSLPEAQLDRFIIRLQMGYPDSDSLVDILKNRQNTNPLEQVQQVITREDLLQMQTEANNIYMKDEMLSYITRLSEATHDHEFIRLGISPRGSLALYSMAKAHAYCSGRDYVIPEDIMDVFQDVCAHRILLNSKARINNITAADLLDKILKETPAPSFVREGDK